MGKCPLRVKLPFQCPQMPSNNNSVLIIWNRLDYDWRAPSHNNRKFDEWNCQLGLLLCNFYGKILKLEQLAVAPVFRIDYMRWVLQCKKDRGFVFMWDFPRYKHVDNRVRLKFEFPFFRLCHHSSKGMWREHTLHCTQI